MITNLAVIFLLGLLVGVLTVIAVRGAAYKHWPCYRCGVEAVDGCEYMGLHYCRICRDVVSMTYPAVQHDPPYGFPGSQGYLEFPKKV